MLGLTGGHRVPERATCEGSWPWMCLGGIGGLEELMCTLIEMTFINEMPKVEYHLGHLVLYSMFRNHASIPSAFYVSTRTSLHKIT